jgi:hypothetical protein
MQPSEELLLDDEPHGDESLLPEVDADPEVEPLVDPEELPELPVDELPDSPVLPPEAVASPESPDELVEDAASSASAVSAILLASNG